MKNEARECIKAHFKEQQENGKIKGFSVSRQLTVKRNDAGNLIYVRYKGSRYHLDDFVQVGSVWDPIISDPSFEDEISNIHALAHGRQGTSYFDGVDLFTDGNIAYMVHSWC